MSELDRLGTIVGRRLPDRKRLDKAQTKNGVGLFATGPSRLCTPEQIFGVARALVARFRVHSRHKGPGYHGSLHLLCKAGQAQWRFFHKR